MAVHQWWTAPMSSAIVPLRRTPPMRQRIGRTQLHSYVYTTVHNLQRLNSSFALKYEFFSNQKKSIKKPRSGEILIQKMSVTKMVGPLGFLRFIYIAWFTYNVYKIEVFILAVPCPSDRQQCSDGRHRCNSAMVDMHHCSDWPDWLNRIRMHSYTTIHSLTSAW